MKKQTVFGRAVGLVLLLGLILSLPCYSLYVGGGWDNNYYHRSYWSTGLSMELNQEENSISLQGTDLEGLGLWFRLKQNGLIVVSNVVVIQDGVTEVSVVMDDLDTTLPTSVEVYIKYDAGGVYWSYLKEEDLVLGYDSGQWQFIPSNTEVLENNYNMFYGTESVDLEVITNADIISLSNTICAGLTSDYDKLYAINYWVAQNIYYDYDYYTGLTSSQASTSAEVLASKTTTCSGYATLICDLVQAQGIPCIEVRGYALGLGQESVWTDKALSEITVNHAWNEAYLESEDRWVIMDTTWDSKNTYLNGTYETISPVIRYFDIIIEAFSADHYIMRTAKVGDVVADTQAASSWALADINQALERDILHYDLQHNFTLPVSRAQFCKLASSLIEEMSGQTLDELIASRGITSTGNPFTDTTNMYVIKLYQLGVVNGMGEGLFQPDATITRQQAAVLLCNILNLFGDIGTETQNTTQYSDQADIASWALDSVNRISALSVMMGSDGAFNPNNVYTLEQGVITMNRLYDVILTATTQGE